MAFPAAFLDDLIARNPIDEVVGNYVQLTRKGNNYFGLCPFHSEKTGSFSVAPEKGIYYCFGCHKGGGVINFIMEKEGFSFLDAVRFLAERAGMTVPEDEQYQSAYRKKERLWALSKDAARYFHSQLKTPQGEEVRQYIQKRGLSPKTVTRFGLGFAPNGWNGLMDEMMKKGYTKEEMLDAGLLSTSQQKGSVYDRFRNRLMFPIIDLRGNVIGFGGRVMDDGTPKYLNSPESIIFNKRKNLFGLNVAKNTKMPYIILTEGYMDAIALHQYGFDCAVASLGTSLTEEHAMLLAKYTKQVFLSYDSDEAGQRATKRAIDILEKTGVQVKVLRMQGAKDPDEFLQKFGTDRFKLLLESSENHVEYQLLSLQKQFDLTADDQRVEFTKQAAKLIASLRNAVEREIYGGRAAEVAKISAQAMQLEVDKAFKQKTRQDNQKQEKRDLDIATQHRPQSRNIQYENLRSATAEEGILSMIFQEPNLLLKCQDLEGTQFSVELLGRIFQMLKDRYHQGMHIALPLLGQDLSSEEMSHLTSIVQKYDGLVNETALLDTIQVVVAESAKKEVTQVADLMALQERKRKKNGYGGTGI